MYAALKLEWIGHDDPLLRYTRRPSVATVTDMREDGTVVGRRYVEGKLDYMEANSIGSRGVMMHYVLEQGAIYEVRSFVSWAREDCYLCCAKEGRLVRLLAAEAWRYGLEREITPRY